MAPNQTPKNMLCPVVCKVSNPTSLVVYSQLMIFYDLHREVIGVFCVSYVYRHCLAPEFNFYALQYDYISSQMVKYYTGICDAC